MFAYFKYEKRFAVYAELSYALGLRPFFEINTCNGETIVNIPYGQIILTPAERLMAETESHNETRQTENISSPPTGIAED